MNRYFILSNAALILIQSIIFFAIYSTFVCHGLDDIYTHKAYIFIVFMGLLLYFIPTFIASAMNKKYTLQVFLINLFLGFTFVGWLAALIWATIKAESSENYSKVISVIIQIFCILCFVCFCITDYKLFNYDTVKQKQDANMQYLLEYINKN